MLNPITNNKNYLINYAIVWSIIIGAHFAILYSYYHISVFIALLDSLLFNIFFAFLGLSLWNVVRYSHSKANFISLLSSHLVSSLVIVGLWLLTGYVILKYTIDAPAYIDFLNGSFPWRIVSGIFYYSAFTLVYYLVLYYHDMQEGAKQKIELTSMLKEAELTALKHQINPHFLFNSLNSVSALTISSPEKAQEMIIKLSDYLRYSLNQEDFQVTSLEKELDNIKLYLEIEKIRFGQRLDFQFECEPETLKARIPAMILQPLFENAIKHGVYESTKTIHIKLDCNLKDQKLNLKIKNNFDLEAKSTKGAGIGLNNIKERLFLLYKDNQLLKTEQSLDHFIVTLSIPQNESI